MKPALSILIAFIFLSCGSNNDKKDVKIENNIKKVVEERIDTVNNIYSNFKLGFAVEFPENWQITKGRSLHTVIKFVNVDSAAVFVVNIWDEDFDMSLSVYDMTKSDEREAINLIEKQSKSRAYGYNVTKTYFDNFEVARTEYYIKLKQQDYEYLLQYLNYSILNRGILYNFGINLPKVIYDTNPQKWENYLKKFYFIPISAKFK